MGLIAQPFRHPDSGIYYLRRRVPDDLRIIIGKTEIRRSLHTRNYQKAKSIFAIAYAESERMFMDARNGHITVFTQQEARNEHRSPSLTESPVTLSQTLERYIQSLSMSGRQEHVLRRHTVDYSRAINRFIKQLGNRPIAAIQASDIHAFAADLIKPLTSTRRPLATSSARLMLARISSVMAFAVDSGLLESNPVIASRIHKRLGSSKSMRPLDGNRGYTWDEMIQIFSSSKFKNLRQTTGRPGNTLFWLPLIAAYTGARREEIAQLYVNDIKQHDSGHWFIRVVDDKPDKSVKTDSSRRDIPIHDDLISLGFLQLVQGLQPGSRVFPQLVKVSDGYAGIVSKAWREFTQQCGVYRRGCHPLHGFRHTFKTLSREHGIPKEVSDWLTGHSLGNVGDSYGINPMSRMATEMKKYPSIAKATGLLPPT